MLENKYSKEKKMNYSKIGPIILCFLAVILVSQNVSAHSPSNMSLNYDSENQKLETTITHQVSNPDSHYLYNIVIKKNGETYNTFDYTNQPSSSSFTYTYDINATEGDAIEVTALCIQGGSITKQVSVSDENGFSDDSDGSPTPGFEIVLFIISFIIIIIIGGKKARNKI